MKLSYTSHLTFRLHPLVALLAAISLPVTCAQAAVTFTRTGGCRYVEMSNGPMLIRFDTYYGGAPLEWFYNGTRILSPDPKPGTGFQLTYETGQDSTQASANGVTEFHIARADSLESVQLYNYYCRESLPGNWPQDADYYRVTGFAPFFWASLEAIDDALPSHSSGSAQTNWLTRYNPGNKSDFNGPGVPIYFRSTAAQSSGIIMVGNEMAPLASPWHQRLVEVPGGRVAFRIRVSMAETGPGAIAGVLFRRQTPAAGGTMDEIYNAPGYSLNVNYAGAVELIHQGGSPSLLATTNLSAASLINLRSPVGITLELRTYNYAAGTMDVFVDQVQVADVEDSNPTLGPHVGLLAIAPPNSTLRFFDREVFDVGLEFESTLRGHSNGVVESEMIIRPAEGTASTHNVYRMNTVAFLSSTPTFLESVAIEEPRGHVLASSTNGSFLAPILQNGDFGLWAGETNGSIGLYCVPADATINGSLAPAPHALIQSHNQPGAIHQGSFIHLNAMAINDNSTPVAAATVSLRAFWAGVFMQDIAPARPSITIQPAPLTTASGAEASFSVVADGSRPPAFQWYKDGNAIASATNASLTLSMVQPADAGRYNAVITNKAGVTSSIAAPLLLTNVPARLTDLHVSSSGSVALKVRGANALAYRIEASTNLVSWMQVGMVNMQNGVGDFPFTPAPGTQRQYFRAVSLAP